MALKAFVGGCVLLAGAWANADDIDAASVAAYFDAAFAIERNEHELAGVVVSVVKNGGVIFKKGYGYADLEKRVAADPDQSIFRIASISKTFTWTAVMQLVEQGRIDLDADIQTYLDFDIPKTFPEPVRMRDLMTHSGGFEELGIGGAVRDPAKLTPLGAYLASHMPARVRTPGTFAAYSNFSTGLAGHIVSRVSGEPWEDYIEAHVIRPLGMTSTTVRQPLPAELASRRAISYEFEDGRFVPSDFLHIEQQPSGVISTTAADMARYMIAHLQFGRLGDTRILEEATARRMQSELFRHDPDVSPFLHGFYRGDRNGLTIFGHGGDMNQFHSDLVLFPDLGTGVFISFNSDPGAQARGVVLAGFTDRFFPNDLPSDTKGIALDSLDEYAGEWTSMRRNTSSLERLAVLTAVIPIDVADGEQLRMRLQDETSRWIATAKDRFRSLYGQERLVFKRDDAGAVAYAFLSSVPVIALERLPWYESPALHTRLFALVGLVALAAVAGYGWRMFKRAPHGARLPRSYVALAWSFSVATIVLLGGLAYGLSTDTDAFQYGLPDFIVALIWLARALVVAIGALLLFAVLVFVRRQGTIGARVRYGVLAAIAGTFGWQLWFWNLV